LHYHFFDNNWENVTREISQEKAHKLKECLTVLLNEEFSDLWFCEDEGYKDHEKFRKFIVEEWRKNKDYDELINKCVIKLKHEL
jgi:hypothetical protein